MHAERTSFRAAPFSTVPGVAWPGIPAPAGASMLALQYQLDRSQWWPRERLIEHQFRQVRELAAHAIANAPHYRKHLERAGLKTVGALDPETFLRWPITRKAEVGDGRTFEPAFLPPAHGPTQEAFTTGSTGVPTRVVRSSAANLFIAALNLRDHLWHQRDFSAKYGAMRSRVETGRVDSWWSLETNVAFRTGPLATYASRNDPEKQLDWLMKEKPAYVLAYPTNLRVLAMLGQETGRVPEGIRQVISFTQVLPPDVRALIARLWKTKVIDVYSCEEFGPIALQCPLHEHFHVQAENLYVEVLREDGQPCAPGETGIVVVTSLHNFAMPLLRYELGDYAEVGAPCPCGRGLPVLKRIAGRVRNMARDPSGRRFMPWIPFGGWLEIAPIRGIQLIQKTPAQLELRYVMAQALSPGQAARLTAMLQSQLGYPFEIRFTRTESLERRPGEKFEDFISEIV